VVSSNHNAPIPLFTEAELADAFRLILPSDRALKLAREWFELFGDEDQVDEGGRYLFIDWRDDLSLPAEVRNQSEDPFAGPVPSDSVSGGMYDWLVSTSPGQLEEMLLSFSDMHLDLIAVSSPTLRKQVEVIRGSWPPASMAKRLGDLNRTLIAMRDNSGRGDEGHGRLK
jgi:hypothetical protein